MNILIVDDNEGCLQLLTKILEFVPKSQVTSAINGSEAWWHLSDPALTFDLIITDVNMPRVNGLALIQRIRATPRFKNLRIIICSGLNDRITVENFHPFGVHHYVLKPYSFSAMLSRINLAMSEPPPS
jgi:YesN/AraC family two-component response regulator